MFQLTNFLIKVLIFRRTLRFNLLRCNGKILFNFLVVLNWMWMPHRALWFFVRMRMLTRGWNPLLFNFLFRNHLWLLSLVLPNLSWQVLINLRLLICLIGVIIKMTKRNIDWVWILILTQNLILSWNSHC